MKKFISILMTMLLLLTLAGGSTVFAESTVIDLSTGLTTDATTGYTYIPARSYSAVESVTNLSTSTVTVTFEKIGAWAEYKVNAPEAALYDISLHVGSYSGQSTFSVTVDNTTTVKTTVTNYSNSAKKFIAPVYLEKGEHVVKITFVDKPSNEGTSVPISRVYFERNNEDSIKINSQGYVSAVDTISLTGIRLSFQKDHWAEYEINLTEASKFKLVLKVGAPDDMGFSVLVNGKDTLTAKFDANTGSTYTPTAECEVGVISLNAGKNTIRVTNTLSGCYFDALTLTAVEEEATATAVTFTDSSSTEVSAVPAGTLNATVTFGSDVTDEVDCYLAVYKEKDGVKELIGYDKANAGDTPQMTVTGIATGETGCTYDAKVFLWKSDLTTAIKAYSIGAASE